MKTYIKGIKTVAVIFLSLALFSCQDEQIEPQDTLSTESNQDMLKPGKGKGGTGGEHGGRKYFTVSLVTSLLVPDDCQGKANSKGNLLWFDRSCCIKPKKETDVGAHDYFVKLDLDDDLYLSAIGPAFFGTNGRGTYNFFVNGFKGGVEDSADYRGSFEGDVVDFSSIPAVGKTFNISNSYEKIYLYSEWTIDNKVYTYTTKHDPSIFFTIKEITIKPILQ